MRFIDYINEEYYSSVRVKDSFYTIYKNPDAHDFKDLTKELRKYGKNFKVRFIADINNEDIYVWDAHMAIHDEIEKYIQRQGDNLGYRLIEDEGDLQNGKINSDRGLYNLTSMIDKNSEDYQWMRKYFV